MTNSIKLKAISVNTNEVLKNFPMLLINNQRDLVFTDTTQPGVWFQLITDFTAHNGNKITLQAANGNKFAYYSSDLKSLLKRGSVKVYKLDSMVYSEPEINIMHRHNDDVYLDLVNIFGEQSGLLSLNQDTGNRLLLSLGTEKLKEWLAVPAATDSLVRTTYLSVEKPDQFAFVGNAHCIRHWNDMSLPVFSRHCAVHKIDPLCMDFKDTDIVYYVSILTDYLHGKFDIDHYIKKRIAYNAHRLINADVLFVTFFYLQEKEF